MKKCAICDSEITDNNDTKEHLIPNSIGGRKKIKGFICNACNNKSGEGWDSGLANCLNPLSLIFNIKRERGGVPSQIFETTGGDRLNLNADGCMDIEKPEYTETPVESGVEITIRARSKKEARKMLQGVKRKYKKIDVDDLLGDAQVISSYSKDMLKLELNFGDLDSGRSMVKSTLALAAEQGISPRLCEKAISYLRDEDGEACFGYYYTQDLLTNRPSDAVFHCVAIQGDPSTKQLLGYVEYYGAWRMVVCLSNNYSGGEIKACYAINPVSGDELAIDVNLCLPQEEVSAAFNCERMPSESIGEAFDKVMQIGMLSSFEREKNRVIGHSVDYAFENCGAKEAGQLLPEHIEKLVSLILEGLEPFVRHQLSSRRKR